MGENVVVVDLKSVKYLDGRQEDDEGLGKTGGEDLQGLSQVPFIVPRLHSNSPGWVSTSTSNS